MSNQVPNSQPSLFEGDNMTPSKGALPTLTLKSDFVIEMLDISGAEEMTDEERSQWLTYEGHCESLLSVGDTFNLNRLFGDSIAPDLKAGLITKHQFQALEALLHRRIAELKPAYDPSSPLDGMVDVNPEDDWRARQMNDA